jgi:K+-transporting ATPase ATPase C chain
LKEVQARIDTFLVHNPGVNRADIPSDLVTASGSGLDPHISVQGAQVQAKRVAISRNLSEEKVKALIDDHIERPLLGLFGTEKVNVLQLNIGLDKLK